MEIASLTFAVVGAVELVKRAFDRDFKSVAIIVVAGVVGAVLAPQVLVDGVALTWFGGLVLGLGASGLVTTVSRVSNV